MVAVSNFHSAFSLAFREFFGYETELGWEIYELSSDSSSNEKWATFTIRNPLAGRALVFRYSETESRFYAHLKIQVIPGEENWDLDVLFLTKGYTTKNSVDILNSSGEWTFHSIALHYFGIILSFCPRIMEPDFIVNQ